MHTVFIVDEPFSTLKSIIAFSESIKIVVMSSRTQSIFVNGKKIAN